jgi:hypothetical protein
MNNINGKVAKILNSRELVINIGSESGVSEGMIFNVLDPSGEDIRDPDTGRVLGSLRRTKLQVKVTVVYSNMAVAMTFKRTTHHIGRTAIPALGSDFSAIARLLDVQRTVVKQETLKKPDEAYDPLEEKDSYVKVGDIVELAQADIT